MAFLDDAFEDSFFFLFQNLHKFFFNPDPDHIWLASSRHTDLSKEQVEELVSMHPDPTTTAILKRARP